MKLPASAGISKKDPATILRAVFERMNWSVLQGRYSPAGPHTIARFRSKRFPHGLSGIMRRAVERLAELGEIDMVNVFIDGTKEETNANRYTFVWKKSVEKRTAKGV